MAMTLGERLEEARKRKGISLREAAEATKIRAEYLQAYETGEYDRIQLPEIYVRGFLRNYAKYLKLDVEKTMTDYTAATTAAAPRRGPGRDLRESLGSIHLATGQPLPEPRAPGDEADDGDSADGPVGLPKPVLWAGGTVAVALLAWFLIWVIGLFLPAASADQAGTGSNPGATTAPVNPPARPGPLVLMATDDVHFAVRTIPEGRDLVRNQPLRKDERFEVPREGPVVIRATDPSRLLVEINGRFEPVGSRDRRID